MYQQIQRAMRSQRKPDAIVVLLFNDGKLPRDYAALDKDAGGALSAAAKRTEWSGETGTTLIEYRGKDRYVLLGLGKPEKLSATTLRAASSGLVRTLDRAGAGSARILLNATVTKRVDTATVGQALGEGLVLASFTFDGFKELTRRNHDGKRPKALAVELDDKAAADGLARGIALGVSANFARTLGATPPNIATTTRIATEAQKMARAAGLKCTVIKGAQLAQKKLVGLINVGKASETPPCLIQLEYKPKKASRATVLLVGKTMAYDSGGLSIKVNNGMRGMKYDKLGGMAVLGAMHAVAHVKPACNVVALLPTAENAISDEAYRPDDILHYPNGVTVEVTNTDAEGRLILADALAYGCKTFKPDAVIDLATLTGGVKVALGSFAAGLFCDDDKLRARVEAAAELSGERVWRLPLFDDYKDMMKAKHADIWNSAPVRDAHPIQGAAFLSYFVPDDVPWAHLDIAGTGDIEKDQPPLAAGPTGYGVRLLAEMLAAWK